MELWIRTQSKQSLVKVDNVSITEQPNKRCNVESGDLILGRYNSFERALEVLDEIQCLLNGSITKKLYVNGDYCGSWKTQRNEIVYEMSKE